MKTSFSPKQWITVFVVAAFAIYVIFQARFLIFGPQLSINSPKDGEVVYSEVVTIVGRAKNVSWLSLNDRQIFTDEKGVFSEKLIVSPGLSIMTLSAKDRFERETRKTVRIIFNG